MCLLGEGEVFVGKMSGRGYIAAAGEEGGPSGGFGSRGQMDPYGLRERRRGLKEARRSKPGRIIFFSFIVSSAGGASRNEHEVVMGLLAATRYAIGAMASHT